MKKTTFDHAYYYVNKPWSVVPISPGFKAPSINGKEIRWKEYQKRQPSSEELRKWFEKTKNGVGVVTGKISNLVVVDTEKGCDFSKLPYLPKTLVVATGGGGYHFYYKDTTGIPNSSHQDLKYDIKGEGGQVVAPPTIHPKPGIRYRWATDHPLYSDKIAPCPQWLLLKHPEQCLLL